jgi:3-methyladenine DNA glycosylase AlkD
VTRDEVLSWLEKRGSRRNVAGMARYGITARRAFGVSMATMLSLRKRLGKDHALALSLWDTGWHEAKVLAALVDEPARVTRRQMNAWAAGFENWADCDTVCFHLFDKTPYAWDKARQWAVSRHELVKRAGFALMASLALHDKTAPDRKFSPFLRLIETGAQDPRNFVKKGVSWALRGTGHRNRAMHGAALKLARRLAHSEAAAPRWVGKDALRDLTRPAIIQRVARRVDSGSARSSSR